MNGWITKWLVGALWGVLIGIIVFMGNVVKANDVKSTEEHTNIRYEFNIADQKIREKIAEDIEKIRVDQMIMLVKLTQILTTLKSIKED